MQAAEGFIPETTNNVKVEIPKTFMQLYHGRKYTKKKAGMYYQMKAGGEKWI